MNKYKRKFGSYLNNINFKKRKTHCYKSNNLLYKEVLHSLAPVNDEERDYFWKWCSSRHIEDVFTIQAIVYWIRIKNNVSVSFLLRDVNKELYMILCIHLSLKWHGYDESFNCNFLYDLKNVCPDIGSKEHRKMELEILDALGWELQ